MNDQNERMNLSGVDCILRCDIKLMDPVYTSMSAGDKQSFLSVLVAFRSRGEEFAYLEVGSYRGGSLQPYLLEPLCKKIFSIDKRPGRVRDARGRDEPYPVSTEEMIDELRLHYGAYLHNLVCIESDTINISLQRINVPPSICLIDGEHTDDTVFQDLLFCLSVCGKQPVILFHDTQIVYRGVRRCVDYLTETGIEFYSYMLPDKMAVIEVARLGLIHHEQLLKQVIASPRGIFEAFERLGYYRDWYNSKTGRLAGKLSTFSRLLRFV